MTNFYEKKYLKYKKKYLKCTFKLLVSINYSRVILKQTADWFGKFLKLFLITKL